MARKPHGQTRALKHFLPGGLCNPGTVVDEFVARPSWDEWFLGLAQYVSTRSKDPSTKCGAAIVRPDKTIACVGYNGFPRNIADDPRLLADREEKYKRVVHCEMNAILTAREPLTGYTLYVWPFLTCERCAVHVIQAGIQRVVAPEASNEHLTRWAENFVLARTLFEEAGIGVLELPRR